MIKNEQLAEMLNRRGMGITALAKTIYSGHAHLSQVLRGQRRGTPTWNKLINVLDAKEMEVAMAFANVRLLAQKVALKLEPKGGAEGRPRVVLQKLEGAEPRKAPVFEKPEHSANLQG